MKIISWNVAGFRACLKKGFADFFYRANPDIICLQESKVIQEEVEFHPEGYELILNPALKKGYAGTMIYTRIKPLSITYGMGIVEHDQEGRMITLEFTNFFLITLYVPNSKRDLERLEYREKWEDDFFIYVKKLEQQKPVIFCGDLNVSHKEIDICNPKTNQRSPGFTIEERSKFSRILDYGYVDTYRHRNPNKIIYSWWSYLNNAREKNIGWRLDYFVISDKLLNKLKDAQIYNGIYGSDHCPIEIEISI